MSEAQDKKIAQLEQEVRAAQELLFHVLDTIGEPVTFDIKEAKEKMQANRRIDLNLNEEGTAWTLGVVTE